MRSFVGERISPSLVHDLHRLGCDAVHPRDRGRLVIVRDGLRPADLMVDAVLTVDEGGRIAVEPLP